MPLGKIANNNFNFEGITVFLVIVVKVYCQLRIFFDEAQFHII